MLTRLTGGLIRALLVVVIIAAPAFMLPSVSQAAQEISLIVGAIIGAFTMFEYASSHPGLIDFRFAPPYNRIRFITFCVLVLTLVFLCRATAGGDGGQMLEIGDAAAALVNFPLSPVNTTASLIGEGAEPAQQDLLRRALSLSFLIAFVSFAFFGLMLWFFKWPVGREKFNLWANLPTFEPSSGRDVQRRMVRDGFANILIGISTPYVLPVLASRSGGWFDPSVLQNFQPLIWGCVAWAFVPASMIIRGAALLKVAWLVKRAGGR